MPSPFPGMDPFIENRNRWSSFHARMVVAIADFLVPLIRPKYMAVAEQRVYVEREPEPSRYIQPDVSIYQDTDGDDGRPSPTSSAVATLTAMAPKIYTLPELLESEKQETYLEIQDTDTQEVVTTLEVLSPSNKRAGSEGGRLYWTKRQEVLLSQAHLVELDLLREGQRPPTVESLKETTDYCALVCRGDNRPLADVYEWTLRDSLPGIPIPLASGDTDVKLDLQGVFNTVYERGGYDYILDYESPPEPKLREKDQSWGESLLAERK